MFRLNIKSVIQTRLIDSPEVVLKIDRSTLERVGGSSHSTLYSSVSLVISPKFNPTSWALITSEKVGQLCVAANLSSWVPGVP